MPLTPMKRYQKDLQQPDFIADAAQLAAVHRLQTLHDELITAEKATGFWHRLHDFLSQYKTKNRVKGVYFWGGVGRGKTYLMDSFYESLPFEKKMRAHFYRFMKRVHQELKALEKQVDPLRIVAHKISSEARVICLDEFFVTDITDAMILANLLEGLFDRGVTLVMTSNRVPDDLYKDGLQRARFLPAIDLIKQYMTVMNLDGGLDYRLRSLEKTQLYHCPLSPAVADNLYHSFYHLVPDKCEIRKQHPLEIEGRRILSQYCAEDVVWFSFNDICDGPRSQNDYIELAREYHAVLISDVPALTETKEAQAKRFICLIDEFYDRNVKVIMSAENPLDQLYSGHHLTFEFERTISRLLEMQSHEYLARAHKP